MAIQGLLLIINDDINISICVIKLINLPNKWLLMGSVIFHIHASFSWIMYCPSPHWEESYRSLSLSLSVISKSSKEFLKKSFYFILEYCQLINDVVIVSEQRRDSYTCIYSSPKCPPIQAATSHWAELHALYNRSLFGIHFNYGRVSMSILNSLTIPSSSSSSGPHNHKSVSLFLFCK